MDSLIISAELKNKKKLKKKKNDEACDTLYKYNATQTLSAGVLAISIVATLEV